MRVKNVYVDPPLYYDVAFGKGAQKRLTYHQEESLEFLFELTVIIKSI